MEDLPDPSLMLAARDAAYAETYAMERQRLTDAEWARFQPVLLRAMDAQRRQIMIRFELREKG